MAESKVYSVRKGGAVVRELKTLTAAKKLADAEGAEIFCDGKLVYSGRDATSETKEVENKVTGKGTGGKKTGQPEKYTLTDRMNIRKEPSLESAILGVAEPGTVVDVAELKNDWLCLADGRYILFGGGKFARKG